jgi:hypothetical protein
MTYEYVQKVSPHIRTFHDSIVQLLYYLFIYVFILLFIIFLFVYYLFIYLFIRSIIMTDINQL